MAHISAPGAAGGAPVPRRRPRGWALLWRLVVETVATCLRYRVTGLAAEAGFFALLSLPPLVLGLAGSLGYLSGMIGADAVAGVQGRIVDFAGTFLTEESVRQVIAPTVDDVFARARIDLISIGFLLSLWSGSRALNVYVDTISIMYGLGGQRGIIRTRALSFSLYVIGLVVGALLIPLVLAGPTLIDRLLPETADWVNVLYWPAVTLVGITFLTSLYHISVPVRTPWFRAVAGSLLALVIWVGGSFVLRWALSSTAAGTSTSIYGPLAAPIVVLIVLYVLAIAVLIGAALNSAVDRIWPVKGSSATDVPAQASPAQDTPTVVQAVPGSSSVGSSATPSPPRTTQP